MAIARSGESPPRTEDDHLLRGDTTFVANVDLPNCAAVHYVTSSVAHADITEVDTTAALAAPGVLAVVVASDLEVAGLSQIMPGHAADWPASTARQVLASQRVRYVGEPIVAIVAETETQAADAAEMVVVDYDARPVVVDLATADAADPIFDDLDTNVLITESLAGSDPIDFSQFEVVVNATVNNNRVAPTPLETRVAAAQWHDGRLIQHAACQGVHPIRNGLAGYYGLANDQVRVITADVGGSFGAKARLYSEELLLGHLARLVDRPVRWVPDRSADMVGLGHSRAQWQHITIAGDRSGQIQAIQARVRVDCGAYPSSGLALARNTGRMLPGPYNIEHVHWDLEAVVTNTTPIVAYRGAGRPESGALINRAVDLFAAEIGIDPIEVRRHNMIMPDQLPYASVGGVTYDSGDYPEAFELLLAELDVTSLRAEQAERRVSGSSRQLGLGVAAFVDRTAGVPGTEYGSVELKLDGGLRVLTGSSPYGQGHYTTWAQLVSERTGVDFDQVEVVHGDTDLVPRGGITGGSRSAQKAGSAIAIATDLLVTDMGELAASALEADVHDVVLDIERGCFHVTGSPGAATVTWGALAVLASEANDPGNDPGNNEIVHRCETDYDTDSHSVPYGAYGAVVGVDTETGEVTLERIVTVDDAGTIIHRDIVLGQVHGGTAQGIGQALYEEFVYDSEGNPLTGDFMSYVVPSTTEFPMIEAHLTVHPSPNNVLGAKGIGESGTIGATPAVQNAVVDALSHLGVRHIDMPLTPQRVWQAISEATVLGR